MEVLVELLAIPVILVIPVIRVQPVIRGPMEIQD
jgi:hypothetical protein